MLKLPRWWRIFNRQALIADLLAGRKVVKVVTDDEGNRTTFIEKVDKPIPPLFADNPDEQYWPPRVGRATNALTNQANDATMVEIDNSNETEAV